MAVHVGRDAGPRRSPEVESDVDAAGPIRRLDCDDGVVEPLVEASMPPVVADAPVGNDVEAVKDEWSRIPGRVTVKYNVEEGEYHTTDGVLSMREIDEDLAISFAFSGAFRARLKSNEFGHVLVASPTGIDLCGNQPVS